MTMNIDEALEIIEESAPENNEAVEQSVEPEVIGSTEQVELPPVDDAAEENSDLPDLSEVENMRNELERLRSELTEKRSHLEKMDREYSEFSELYPDVRISSLPDSVWQSVNAGVPLAAAYALEARRAELAAKKAGIVNTENSQMSSGALNSDNYKDYFSPAEVKAMSPREVRANYTKIISSMSKCH